MLNQIPELETLMSDADHVDIHTAESPHTLREFAARFLTYQPGWVDFLYRIRAAFVRLLGMRQGGMPKPDPLQPETVPFEPGQKIADAGIFHVHAALENQFWIGSAEDKHLIAYLALVQEPLSDALNRFHIVTIVHYRNWAGPVYFNAIRPFHHLVVGAMKRHAA